MRVSTSEPSLNRLNLDYRELDARALELHRKLLAGGAQEREWGEQYLRLGGKRREEGKVSPTLQEGLGVHLKEKR